MTEPVFKYSNYRSFLRDYYDRKRERDPRWSYGVWAKQLRLKSSSTMIMVVNGTRHPGPKLVKSLNHYFGFKKNEAEYFEDLVRLQKAKNDVRLSVMLMEKLSHEHPKKKFFYLDQKSFFTISNWYYYVIREMVHVRGFSENPEWISEALNKRITVKEARTALLTLIELDLLKRDENGKLVQSRGHLDTSNDVANEGLKRFHEQTLEISRSMVRELPPELREITGTTFAMNLSNLPRAKDLIRKFKRDLCDLLEEPNSDGVFHLEIAFTPLTKIKTETSLK